MTSPEPTRRLNHHLSVAATLAGLLMGFLINSSALAAQSVAPAGPSDVLAGEPRCNVKPYGATEDQLNAYLAVKFGTLDRLPLHDYGITEQQIVATDPATLAIQLLEACGYQIRGSAEAYEIEKAIRLESHHHALYVPTVCSSGLCSGSHDLAHLFSSVAECKRYLVRLNLPYNTSLTDQSTHGYCAKQGPAVQ